MGFLDVLGDIAGAVVSELPGGKLALAAVNAFLPEDKKLSETATAGEARAAHSNLPPEAQVQVCEQHTKLAMAEEKGWTDRTQFMNEADKSGHSTRPKIALLMAWTLAIPFWGVGAAMCVAISSGENMSELAQLWPAILAFFGVPMGILNKYFGELRKEQANRLNVSNNPIAELITGTRSLLGGGRDK